VNVNFIKKPVFLEKAGFCICGHGRTVTGIFNSLNCHGTTVAAKKTTMVVPYLIKESTFLEGGFGLPL